MKKYIFSFIFLVMFLVCTNARQAKAYSVTVEEDSMYAKVIPPYIIKNAVPMFKKQVQSSMKYYDKYKDADSYTYATKVPDKYRDFIEIAKKIQDSDEIVIRYPFYIYDATGKEFSHAYYFVAERNHKKLCIFSIDVYVEDGRTIFSYDKMIDSYSSLDGNITEKTLFYQIGDKIYAETPEQVGVVRDMSGGGQKMMGDSTNTEGKAFFRKKYEEKRDMVFDYLDKIKEGKAVKKSNENIKSELKNEYRETQSAPDTEEHGRGMYIAVFVGILCILVVSMVVIKRKKE